MNEAVGGEPHLTREQLASAVRRWWLLVAATAVVGGAASFGVSKVLPPTYRATAQLFVAPLANPTIAVQEVVLGQNLARSYVQLADAEVVLVPAMQKVGWLQDLKTFRDKSNITQVRDTFVITVSFDDSDRQRASDAANAIAESFVKQSASIQSTLQGNLTLWQPATVPEVPESPRIGLNTALGAIGAAAFALLGIAVLRYLDDRIADPDQVRPSLGLAFLAEVPQGPKAGAPSGDLFVRDRQNSIEAESFLSLRTSLLFANVDQPPRTILVTSALPLEGKSVVSANLALAFAQAGTPTILVDADLRRPSQHRRFGIAAAPGLTDLLTGQATLTNLERFRVAPNLLVIPAGSLPPNPAELLASARMTALLRELTNLNTNDRVVVDTSPVLAVTDAVGLATKVAGCLLVVDSQHGHGRASKHAIQRLSRVHAPLIGVILNKVSAGAGYYGSYKYPDGREEGRPKAVTPRKK